jgi:hypothetical protein
MNRRSGYNNRRGWDDKDRFSEAVRLMVGKRLTFDQLTGKDLEAHAALPPLDLNA